MAPTVDKASITRLAEKQVYANKYITVFFDDVSFPNGAEGNYTRIKVGTHTGVAILPVRDGKIGLVRQYRYPVSHMLWEAPRGFSITDNTADNARRELAEETGAATAALTDLGILRPDTGILDSEVALYLAHLAESSTFKAVDEVDDAIWLPVADVLAMVADGDITDGFTTALVARAHLRGLI